MRDVVTIPLSLSVVAGVIAGQAERTLRQLYPAAERAWLVGILSDTAVTALILRDGRGGPVLIGTPELGLALGANVLLHGLARPVEPNHQPWVDASVAAGATVNLTLLYALE